MTGQSFSCFFEEKYFYITNDTDSTGRLNELEDQYFLYGHCFTDSDILKDQALTRSEFEYIRDNHDELSGLFVCVGVVDGNVELLVDPLVQYPVFYVENDGAFAISNKLSELSRDYYDKPNMKYLFDSLIYRAPLRGLTPVNSIKMIQFDDLQEGSHFKGDYGALKIYKTNLLFRKGISYEEALSTLADKIRNRASIIAKKFDYIECQLSGGLDCRMVASAFLDYDHVRYYSFGTDSQDRLCFESLSKKFNLKKADKIKFYGSGTHTAAYRVKMLDDLNGLKLHTYGGYMNYGQPVAPNGCRLTGYFGEYIGHKLPSANISPADGSIVDAPHIDFLPKEAIKVAEEYSRPFWKYYSTPDRCGKSSRAINQLFYLNNRGPSHFGMNSVADNLHDSSFNVLYDPMAITVSELSGYSDYENKEGATCLDLICKLGGVEFALFPYENRRIPYYRNFDYVPEVNCFEKNVFDVQDVEAFKKERHAMPSLSGFDILRDSRKPTSSVEILNDSSFDDFFDAYPKLSHLRKPQPHRPLQIHQEILCNFLLADRFFAQKKGLELKSSQGDAR
ncbi:hypothetical protein [Marinimicrobium sp. C2-29]|uniref:hypothetical protein n=1 Tax=Marinimicrobium sp. C2-29 TaxID=3139825 RepID=UPI0031395656